MGDDYKYRDGSPVQVCEGEHGLNVCTSGGRTVSLESMREGKFHAVYEVLSNPQTSGPVAARHNDQNASEFNTIQVLSTVEFISFGHSHIYPVTEYPRLAPLWRERLLAEARILSRSLQGDQAIAYEYLQGDGSVCAWITQGISGAVNYFKDKPLPDPKEYDRLMDEVWKVSDSVKNASAADYEVLHAAGLSFIRIRKEQSTLNGTVKHQIEDFIGVAQVEEQAARETEGAAFWVLDLYGQVVAKDPVSLFAYRFGVLTVRAGAHGWGSMLAHNSARATFHEISSVVRQDLPPAATGLLLGWLKKGLPKDYGPAEEFASQLIGLNLFVFFFCIDFYVFEIEGLPPEERTHTDRAFVKHIAEPLADQIVSAIGSITTVSLVKNLPADSPIRKRIECLGAVIPAMIKSTIREVVDLKQHASAEHRTFGDIFASEGGWAIIRILRDVAKAALEAVVKGKMESAHQADKAYYRALILSIYLHTAPVDASRVKTPSEPSAIVGKANPSEGKPEPPPRPSIKSDWKSKPRRSPSGPDSNGNIGIAKLLPVAGEGVTPDKSTPPPPPRAVRKKVTITPRENRVRPAKRENLGTIGPLRTWREIKIKIKASEVNHDCDVLLVRLRSHKGKLIDKWFEVSEPGAAAADSQAQTEQKALARVDEMNLEPGSTVIFVRHERYTAKKYVHELSKQGHGPQRHEGQLTKEQLRARAVEGKDPVTGTTDDAYRKNDDGTPAEHAYGRNATKINSEEAYADGDDSLRSSDEFKAESAGKQPGDRITVEKDLEDVYGPDYKDDVSGVTRQGSKNNPTGSTNTDFTDGTLKGVYEMDDNGNWNLVTMYPEPK